MKASPLNNAHGFFTLIAFLVVLLLLGFYAATIVGGIGGQSSAPPSQKIDSSLDPNLERAGKVMDAYSGMPSTAGQRSLLEGQVERIKQIEQQQKERADQIYK